MLGIVRPRPPFVALLLLLAACAKSDERFGEELADRDPFVRALAAIALVEQAPGRPELRVRALPILLETVDRSELGLGAPAAAALARAGGVLAPALLEILARGEFMTLERRAAVLDALAAAGELAIPGILDAMRGADVERRRALGLVLVRIGPPSVGPLVRVLIEDPDASMRGTAALLLGEIGPPARNALTALAAALERDDGGVALAAAHALPRINAAGTVVMPFLEAARSRAEPAVREEAAAGIARIHAARAAELRSTPEGDPRNRRGPER